MKLLFTGARSASVLIDETGDYYLPDGKTVTLSLSADSGEPVLLGEDNRAIISLFDLLPDTNYTLFAGDKKISFHTDEESYTLNVRRFGAVGDGVANDTSALQAAILCCPEGGRVLVPAGSYLTAPLFLKSHMTLEIARGATLLLMTEQNRFPIFPGVTYPTTGDEDYLLGSFEGNPLDTFASALNGIGIEDVCLVGEGIVDGRAQEGVWWIKPKGKYRAYRGHLLFLKDCSNITVQGLTFRNSPCWNIHPLFSEKLTFVDIRVEAPADSPNTDGFDPESCRGVKLYGARFSVGDDCIAIKSGKIYMGHKYHEPCSDIEIAWCAMLDGHGGVTVGSELSGGVNKVTVHHCYMRGNDRGLRLKTRRGRGKYAVADDITFRDIRMEGVKVPLVINCLYFCDPDGHSPYVQSREKQPIDDGTPTVGKVVFERVRGTDCRSCVAYLLGLPERPIREVVMRDCEFDFRPDAPGIVPAMADGVRVVHNRGIIRRFVDSLETHNVLIHGITGPEISED